MSSAVPDVTRLALPTHLRRSGIWARPEGSEDGLVPCVLRPSLQKTLDTGFSDGATDLEAETEKPSPDAS